MSTTLHITPIIQQVSIYAEGKEDRSAVFQVFRYGTEMDTVKISYGIQGEGYFRAFREAWNVIMKDASFLMGWVPVRHVAIYARLLRGTALVEELFKGFPYGPAYGEKSWICGRPLFEGKPLIETCWDKQGDNLK